MTRRPLRKAARASGSSTAEKTARLPARGGVPVAITEPGGGPLTDPLTDPLADPLIGPLTGPLADPFIGEVPSALAEAVGPVAAIVGTRGPIGPLRGLAGGSGRLMLGLPRGRGVPSIDVVEFTAACPACGHDVLWIEEREETKLRIIIECPCTR